LADIVDKATRSRMMAGIKGKNTKPEIIVRKALHAAGFRYRLHDKNLPGKPDIVLKKHKAVVFVHGCFWHGHRCKKFRFPTTQSEFWRTKILGNKKRDRLSNSMLRKNGWKCFTIWECEILNRAALEKLYSQIKQTRISGSQEDVSEMPV
jgi:DNA mismatch endonuclease, patch repair protein